MKGMAKTLIGVIRNVMPAPVISMYRNLVATDTRDSQTGTEEERLEAMVGPRGVWQESRDFQINFLRRNGLERGNSLLDIGCGPLRGGIPLIRYLDEARYTGIDIRQHVIEEAWSQIRNEDLTKKAPNVVVSTSFGRAELGDTRFDYIWCFQVLYHLDDQLVEDCLAQVTCRLADDGSCYANVNLLSEEGRWKEFPYVRRTLEFYEAIARRNGLQTRDLGQQRDWGYTNKVPGQYDHMLEFKLAKA